MAEAQDEQQQQPQQQSEAWYDVNNPPSAQKQVLQELTHPYFQEQSGGILNKDLKTGNIDKTTAKYVILLANLAIQARNAGANKFSTTISMIMDTVMSTSSSIGGFERKVQVTNRQVNIGIPEKKDNAGLFGSKK